MKHPVSLFAVLLLLLPMYVHADTYDTHTLVKITIDSVQAQKYINSAKIDVTDAGKDWVKALLTDDEMTKLERLGFKIEILYDEMANDRAIRAIPGYCTAEPGTFPNPPTCYYTASIFNLSPPNNGSLMYHFWWLNQQYPTITRLYDIGDSQDGAYDILAMKVSDNPDVEENEPEMRIYGNIHGDEVSALMVTCDVLDWILSNYASDTDAQKLVNDGELWFIPMGNPYGNANQTRYNVNGVDLNRNFWGPTGSDDGPAWSEAETQAIRDLTEVSGKLFVTSLTFHSGAICFNSVYNYTSAATSDEPIFFESRTGGPQNEADPSPYGLAQAYFDGNTTSGFWYTNGADWYSVRGDTNDWSYYLYSDLDTTLEVTSIKWPDSLNIPTYTLEHRQATINYMLKTFQGINGVMTDSSSGSPLDGTVVATCTATTSPYVTVPHEYKQVLTDPDAGDFHRVLEPGTYTVECRAPGYTTIVVPGIVVTADTTSICNCILTCESLVISNVQISNVTSDSATITWTTNTDADSMVTYDISTPPGTDVYDSSTTSSHSITLSSLNQCTMYYFSVTSGFSGCDTQTDDNFGLYYSFTTLMDTTVFTDDMESGPSLWTADAPWTISGESANSPTNAWSDSPGGQYGPSLDISLFSNVFDLSDLSSCSLSFWHTYDIEDGYDYGYLEISTNGGSSWSGLETFSGTQLAWTEHTEDLTSYVGGSTVQIRYRLTSDSSIFGDGWHIDDVKIGPPGTPCVPDSAYMSHSFTDTCSSGGPGDNDGILDAGETALVPLIVENTGAGDLTGVWAELSSATSGVFILNNSTTFADIVESGNQSSVSPHFSISLAESIPCGTDLDFIVTIYTNEGTFIDTFTQVTGFLSGGTGVLFSDDFESDLGWILAGAGEWERSSPTGLGGSNGTPDPGSAYSGTSVLGNDLTGTGTYNGDYEDSVSLSTARSPAIDCSGATNVNLSFQRWLGVKSSSYDEAVVAVSNNGSTWTQVWINGGSASDTSWTPQTFDISTIADNQSTVFIRFSIDSDSSVNYCGWNIDDFEITGNVPQNCDMNTCIGTGGSAITVADGTEGGTQPLTAQKSAAINITWDTTNCQSTAYHLIWGWGSNVDVYSISGADCTLTTSGTHSWSTDPDTTSDWCWFLIVGNDGSTLEGGWGEDSLGSNRSTAASGYCSTTSVDNSPCVP